jgi:hypothetical protein
MTLSLAQIIDHQMMEWLLNNEKCGRKGSMSIVTRGLKAGVLESEPDVHCQPTLGERIPKHYNNTGPLIGNGCSYYGSLFHCWKRITTTKNCRLHKNDFLKEEYAKWHASGLCLLSRPPNRYNQEQAVEVQKQNTTELGRTRSDSGLNQRAFEKEAELRRDGFGIQKEFIV